LLILMKKKGVKYERLKMDAYFWLNLCDRFRKFRFIYFTSLGDWGFAMKTINLFKKLCSNNLEQNKRQKITNEIKSRMVHNKPFTVDDFNSFANWYNKKTERKVNND